MQFHPWVEKIPWTEVWQPIPVSLPGKSHGQKSLASYRPGGCRVRHDWRDLALMQMNMRLNKFKQKCFMSFGLLYCSSSSKIWKEKSKRRFSVCVCVCTLLTKIKYTEARNIAQQESYTFQPLFPPCKLTYSTCPKLQDNAVSFVTSCYWFSWGFIRSIF